VIYADSLSFSNGLTNTWQWLDTITNYWLRDRGGIGRPAVADLVNTMRFYRATAYDLWRTNRTTRIASIEVYASKALQLVPGENWVSLFMIPDFLTVQYVFGLTNLPAGDGPGTATKISWYAQTTNAMATNVIYLTTNGWVQSLPETLDNMNTWTIPLEQGFNVELPPGSPTQSLVVIGKVPTNAQTFAVKGGTGGYFNVMNYNLPQRTQLQHMNLQWLQTGTPASRDELRILVNANGFGSGQSPRLRVYRSGTNIVQAFPSAGALANTNYIEPDEMIVVRRRNTDAVWTNTPLYSPPTKYMTP
jgi:hypothetical protein